METVNPTNIQLEEKTDDVSVAVKEKKKTRFQSPISLPIYRFTRHVLKFKHNDDEAKPPYCRMKEEKQYSDSQFKEPPVKIPVHAIILASILFLVGSVMITLGALMLTGRIQTQYSDRTWPLIVIGTLVFLPGFYHVRLAYWAWKGDQQFSFEDIPDLDWF